MKCKIVTVQNIALKIYDYFCMEAKRKNLFINIEDPLKRVKHLLGLKNTTLKRWVKQRDTPRDTERQMTTGRKEKTDDFDKEVIRREVIDMFDNQDLVSLRKLKARLAERGINLGKTTIWKIVKSKGFTFKTLDSNRDASLNKPHLVAMRGRFLRKIKEKREEGLDVVYLDESYVNANHTMKKQWCSNDGLHKIEVPSGKGERIIIANAGSSQQGMIGEGDAGLVYRSISTDDRDYHSEMNGDIFKHWLENHLLPALDRPSLLVLDNASYHNVIDPEDKAPTTSSRKAAIAEWQRRHAIDFEETHTKKQLLQLSKSVTEPKKYSIDKVINAHGHEALRLPPYHCNLNPIELVWAKVKGQVAANNKTFKMAETKQLTIDAIKEIGKDFFQKCEQHTQKIERQYWEKDGLTQVQAPVIINPFESSDTE